ncbi:MAG: hypothetical protein WB791_03495 [Waddliaceae bacterium]
MPIKFKKLGKRYLQSLALQSFISSRLLKELSSERSLSSQGYLKELTQLIEKGGVFGIHMHYDWTIDTAPHTGQNSSSSSTIDSEDDQTALPGNLPSELYRLKGKVLNCQPKEKEAHRKSVKKTYG